MAIRVRPATTLTVILAIALAFQILAILSVPVTQSITLCTYDDVKFGVFGLCSSDGTCTKAQIGYSDDDIEHLSGFSLPSNARHSVSKLLIVHPIAAGFTVILFFGAILLHWHGPSSSLELLFFMLLWCMPSFLLTLLSFLVDVLLFMPHLDWGGWIILASTVLIFFSAILLCIMRRTVSSRKAIKKNNAMSAGNDFQLAPLNYGYGTVDGGSDYKVSAKSNTDDNNSDERAPFVNEGDATYNFDDSVRYDDIGDMQQTQAYDSVRDSNNASAQSRGTYRSAEPLTAPLTAYRGGYDYTPPSTAPVSIPPTASPEYERSTSEPVPSPEAFTPQRLPDTSPESVQMTANSTPKTAPYPSELPMALLGDIPEVSNTQTAPYPQDDGILPRASRLAGPRPMPPTSRSTSGGTGTSAGGVYQPNDEWGFGINDAEDEDDEPSAPPMPVEDEVSRDSRISSVISNPELEREPTYRTRIARNLEALQPATYSSESFAETDEDLLRPQQQRASRNIGELSDEDDTTYERTFEEDVDEKEIVGSEDEDDMGDSYQQATQQPQTGLMISIPDDASSTYSSRVPSTINTPIDTHFRRQPSLLQKSQIPEDEVLSSSVIHSIGDHGIMTPSDVTLDDYPFPDPSDRRTTPAPSFSNESIGSSTFTSVSQRGINPKYFEKNPDEYAAYVQRQNVIQRNTGVYAAARGLQPQNSSDILIASNPDFTIGSKKSKKSPMGRR